MDRIDEQSFWRWAHSDFLANTERGLLAEFIVALATRAPAQKRLEWDAYDIETLEGIKVEVKASGFVQAWPQDRPSVIRFDISESVPWSAKTNTFGAESTRSADVYVFCVHKEKERSVADPLKLSQWEFHVIPTKKLEAALGKQKSVGIGTLRRVGAVTTDFAGLRECIKDANRT